MRFKIGAQPSIMSDNYERGPDLGRPLSQQLANAHRIPVIQRATWFVGQDQLGSVDQRPGNGDALLFAHAQFPRITSGILLDTELLQQVEKKRTVGGKPGHLSGKSQILFYRESLYKIGTLKDQANVPPPKSVELAPTQSSIGDPVHLHLSGQRRQDTRQQVQPR